MNFHIKSSLTMETTISKNPVTLNEINAFLNTNKIAVAGASRNSKKFGSVVMKELLEKGFEVLPVNPFADEIQGRKCYASISDLPADVKHLLIVTNKNNSQDIAAEAVKNGIQRIWIQQMSETPDTIRTIEDAGIPLISKKCILMFVDPVKGPHQFHRFFVKLFGRYPKAES